MQAKKLNDKMLQYILAKCGCEMLTGSEAVALKDHILALEAELGKWPKCRHGSNLWLFAVGHVKPYSVSTLRNCCSSGASSDTANAAIAAFREANPKETCHE